MDASSNSGRRPDWRYQPRSEAVNEILGRTPNWLIRYGNILLLVGTVAILWFAFNYRYPDTVEAKLTLTTVNPAELLTAPRDVNIEQILVESGDTIEGGTTIMVFRSLAEFGEVLFLEDQLLSVRGGTDSALLAVQIPSSLELGSIQEALYDFKEKRTAYISTRDESLSGLSTQELRRRISQQQRQLRNERERRNELERELDLVMKELESQRNLFNNGIIEDSEFRQAEQNEIRTRRILRDSESRIRDYQFNIELLNNQIVNYRTTEENDILLRARDLRSSYNILVRTVDNWKQENLLVAPKEGRIIIDIDVREKKRFREQDVLATLDPVNPEGVLGRIDLPLQGSGKVSLGQKVIIKFLNYPYEEFGIVEGRVEQKSPIPSGDVIPILVGLPKGMVTNTGNQLEPVQFMRGDAEIIVGEKRLLGWLLERGS
ncbi:MAG: hypothetical protein AAFQ37_02385 [Bacteroidota bacterium]